jgi:hypothetical protein
MNACTIFFFSRNGLPRPRARIGGKNMLKLVHKIFYFCGVALVVLFPIKLISHNLEFFIHRVTLIQRKFGHDNPNKCVEAFYVGKLEFMS